MPIAFDRLRKPALLSQHVAQIVQMRSVRTQRGGLRHQRDAGGEITRLTGEQAEKMERIRLFGMRSKDLLVQRLCFCEPALPVMRERGFEPKFAIVHGVPMIEGRWTLVVGSRYGGAGGRQAAA